MNKTDFRLGNLIIAKYYDENGVEQETIAEISGISEDALLGDGWTYMLTTGLETEDYYGMTPIQLTKEILHKVENMQTKNGKYGTYFHVEPFSHLVFFFIEDKLAVSKKEDKKIIWIQDIEYLHQLQNIFYILTNQELNVQV